MMGKMNAMKKPELMAAYNAWKCNEERRDERTY